MGNRAMPAFPYTDLLLEMIDRIPPAMRWSVTCGSALALHGLDYEPTDLDFFGPVADIRRIEKNLTDLHVVFSLAWRSTDPFYSYFGRFLVGGIDVDFVGDFSVENEGTRFTWDAQHPCWNHLDEVSLAGRIVPLFALEDLLLFYLALPDETPKLELIRDALHARGINHAYLQTLLEQWPKMVAPVRSWLGS